MADYDIDIVSYTTFEESVVDYSPFHLAWWLSSPYPFILASAPECFSIRRTLAGRDEHIKRICGIITDGYPSYFKLGEGGWRWSSIRNRQIGTGTGSQYLSGILPDIPIKPGSLSFDEGGDPYAAPLTGWLNVYDDGEGNFIGDGTGTINYRTGAYSITFDRGVMAGMPITVTLQAQGRYSSTRTYDYEISTGVPGPYIGTLSCIPVVPSTVFVSEEGGQSVFDDGNGNFDGDGTGTIDYDTGDISVTFFSNTKMSYPIRAVWQNDGEPILPPDNKTVIEADADDDLYSFQKSFVAGDIVFQGTGTAKAQLRIRVLTTEANDNGSGLNPLFYEGGIYSNNDVLLAYFTFPRFLKDSSKEFDRYVEFEIPR